MSATLLQRRTIAIPVASETFSVCILHRGRWHVTPVSKPFDEVVEMAEDAFRRSGLPVQVRGDDETILFEANADRVRGHRPAPASQTETRHW